MDQNNAELFFRLLNIPAACQGEYIRDEFTKTIMCVATLRQE